MKTVKLLIGVAIGTLVIAGGAWACDEGPCGTPCGDGQCAVETVAMAQTADQPAVVKPAVAKEATIGTEALATLLRAKVPVAVLDARSGKFDDGRRLPGAQALNAASTEEEIGKVLLNKEGLVVTYCAGLTCGASHKLAERLNKLGYKNVVEYPEGIEGWVKAGNKVEETRK
ncbi:MAG: hypothetical protein C0404_05665 [Verrucomicrobia bacterium]|nr:hypothetical protein [Verrucomicrobiota bacterium]